MRTRPAALVACLLFLGTGAAAARPDDAPEWKEFASKEGRFRVLMPRAPEKDRQEAESDLGKTVLHLYAAESGGTVFGANYCDFPAGVRKVPLKQVYDSSRDGAVANLEGKLAAEKDVKLGGQPGREILVEVAGGQRLFRARVCLAGQRLYQVVVFGPKEAATSKEADRFLDSFKLDEK